MLLIWDAQSCVRLSGPTSTLALTPDYREF